MSNKCELTGKRPLKGHNVSHANNKTKRKFNPSIKKIKFKSDILNFYHQQRLLNFQKELKDTEAKLY